MEYFELRRLGVTKECIVWRVGCQTQAPSTIPIFPISFPDTERGLPTVEVKSAVVEVEANARNVVTR
ncbi:hypothetical protein WG66_006115 [Moniliophthora roreri]|nr:hypothetical protein WG66_006115 [Moniliophthora roreri]